MKIIHISDLHFGRVNEPLVPLLSESIRSHQPDILIISGDFTQIGSEKEFAQARAFIEALNIPALSVPGNHDVPAYDLWERFKSPYENYREAIGENLEPAYQNDQAAFLGINSARRALPHWNWANGAVSDKQRRRIQEYFSNVDLNKWRICILHHPVHKTVNLPIDVKVFGAGRTLKCFEQSKVDLVLTGHVHHASVSVLGDNFSTVYLSASTAFSTRKRFQNNGYNLVQLDHDKLEIDIYTLHEDEKAFVKCENLTHMKR